MNKQYDLAYAVLGPIFRFFCFRLRLIEEYKENVPLLFLSRGGLRIHHFYELYLNTNNLAALAPRSDFYVSRMAVFRALLAQSSRYAAEEIAKEYRNQSVDKALGYFLPESLFPQWQTRFSENGGNSDSPLSADFLLDLMSDSRPHARLFSKHIHEQEALLSEYFASLVGADGEVILVDTGWSGSIVKSLQEMFPGTAMTAAFFGRFNYGKPPPPWFASIFGLVMQSEHYNPSQPQSALIFHRHLIESLCEPAWPSVEFYVRNEGQVTPATGFMPESVKAPEQDEIVACAVKEYLANNPAKQPGEIAKEYRVAIKKLSRLIRYPSVLDAKALGMPPRSADFGRDLQVPVLLKRTSERSRLQRVKQSLWHQGQAALEFGIFRLPVQYLITRRRSRSRLLRPVSQLAKEWTRALTLRKGK